MGEIANSVNNNSSKKWTIIISGIALLVLGGTTIYALKQGNFQSVKSNTTVTPSPEKEGVGALGRIEPKGEVIQLAPAPNMAGAKVDQLLVKEGDQVTEGQIIAILHDHETKKVELERAKKELKVAQANLDIVKAGAKQGEIEAQKATIQRLKAQLDGEIATNNAKIARLNAQLNSEKQERLAIINRQLAELKNAEIEWKRYEKLAEEGVISQSDLEQKRLVLDTAQQRYDEAKASYQKTIDTIPEEIREIKALNTQTVNTLEKQIQEAISTLDKIAEVREVDVVKAEAEVERARALIKQSEVELDLTLIKAPKDSQVIKIKAYPGENIDNATGVVELGNTQEMMVVAEVYESDISKVKIGQQVEIRSENGAFSGQLTGKVAQIGLKIGKNDVLSTDPASDVDARVVEVKIAINPSDSPNVSSLIYSQVLVKILTENGELKIEN
jgi:HlyD family secretion protein